MKFEIIKITGGQADAVDPRTTPGSVPAPLIKETPQTILGTDTQPTVAVFALEGTAAQTVTVQQFVLDESGQSKLAELDDPSSGDAARRFYIVGAAFVVTVGTLAFQRAEPGKVYYRLTSAPAADAVLKIAFTSGSP